MSASDLLRRLDEAATPGPWQRDGTPSRGYRAVWAPRGGEDGEGCEIADRLIGDAPEDDARLIATLRTLLPELRAVVEAAAALGVEDLMTIPESRTVAAVFDAMAALDARAAELGGTDG